MNANLIATIASKFGLDPVILSQVIEAAKDSKVSINQNNLPDYFPDEDEKSFYLPSVSKGFYIPSMPRSFPISIPSNFYVNNKIGRKLVGL